MLSRIDIYLGQRKGTSLSVDHHIARRAALSRGEPYAVPAVHVWWEPSSHPRSKRRRGTVNWVNYTDTVQAWRAGSLAPSTTSLETLHALAEELFERVARTDFSSVPQETLK